jgi:hypothetical protein
MTEEDLKHRIKNALILLKDGYSFKVGDLTFSAKDNSHFLVTGWTLRNDLKNITKQTALFELNETKDLFSKMLIVSSELADFIKEREIEFSLGYDYGMGGLEICREIDGQIEWKTELQK